MTDRSNDGYSLLELLVALALTAVIATMMAQTTRQLHPLRQIQAKYDAQAVADRLTQVIANDLKSALPLPLSGSDAGLPMIGAADNVRFIAVVKTGFAEEGLREVSYALEAAADGRKSLVRRIALRRFAASDVGTAVQKDEVFDRVGSLTLRYLGRQDQGGLVWENRWGRADELPLAVQISLNVAGTTAVAIAAFPH